MKRNHSQNNSPELDIFDDGTDHPLERHTTTLSVPCSNKGRGQAEDGQKPSKVRRKGEKLLSALRSLTNSASSGSANHIEYPFSPSHSPHIVMTNTEMAKHLAEKVSQSFALVTRPSGPPTVVIRSPKSRPSVVSLDKGVLELTPEVSPETSGEISGNSSKQSGQNNVPPRTNSTGMTSMESKLSAGKKLLSGHSSDTKKGGAFGGGALIKTPNTKQLIAEETAISPGLTPIAEQAQEAVIPLPVPSESFHPRRGIVCPSTPSQLLNSCAAVITVEKAAAAKIFFECHYNTLLASGPSPRSIRRRDFEALLYENAPILSQQNIEDRRRDWQARESRYLREIRVMKSRNLPRKKGVDPMVNQYEVVKVLGKGSFGVVRLVREKEDVEVQGAISPVAQLRRKNEVYAMKVIRKSDMLRNSQEGHLRAERDFLVASEGSRWVVPLIASFQDQNNLYLIMDYMPGGDFLGLLIRDNILSEAVTKWYVAEMILCIEEAHRLKWIHRDIKPDNFLISPSGHLKISDFGLAFDGHWSHDQAFYSNHRYSLLLKLGIAVDGDALDKKDGRSAEAAMKLAHVLMGGKDKHEKKSDSTEETEGILNWRNRTGNRSLARSVVGTSQYMAPEVVRGEQYDARCDWWSVAIILYECLYGHTPFLADEGGRAQTKANIIRHKETLSFPSRPAVSSRCQDLMRRIICEKSERLCSRRYRTGDLAAGTQAADSRNKDYQGRYVYPDDAEDIKNHRWFRDIQWEKLHTLTPPFVPAIRSHDDTHYFDEEEPISDFSTSLSSDMHPLTPPTEEELESALRGFNREIQILARGYVGSAYDSTKLRRIEREIEAFALAEEQKEYLRGFVRAYGRREKKRPRDRLLRDEGFRQGVLECRKRAAFLGYSWRRMRKDDLMLLEGLRNARDDSRDGVREDSSGNSNSGGKREFGWPMGKGRMWKGMARRMSAN